MLFNEKKVLPKNWQKNMRKPLQRVKKLRKILNTPMMNSGIIIKRGYVYFANLSPTVGSEINKVRPVIVVSNNINNLYAETITVIPITSNVNTIRSFEVFIPEGEAGLPKDSKAKCDQVRTIDKLRFIKELGQLSVKYIFEIELAVRKHLEI